MPNFWGCRCCGKKITHRVFSSAGVLQWSGLHPGIMKSLSQDTSNAYLWSLGLDDGGRLTTVRYRGVAYREFLPWVVSDGTKGATTQINQAINKNAWTPDKYGGIYYIHSTTTLRKLDSNFATDWDWLASTDLPVVGSTTVSLISTTTPQKSQDDGLVAVLFSRSNGYAGVAILDYQGNFQGSFEEKWTVGFSSVPPITACFNTDGNIVLVFPLSVSGLSSGSGVTFVYQPDGTLIDSYSFGGINHWLSGIYGDAFIYGNPVSNVVYSRSLTDGSLLASIDLNSYCTGSQTYITACQVSQDGTVYAACGVRNLVAMDSDLNIIWTFNENDGETSGSWNYPIQISSGLTCNNGYVAIGGTVKKKKFDPSQLVIVP